MKKSIIGIILLGIGILGFINLNKNSLLLWNANQIEVNTDSPLTKDKVKIEFGISVNTINRTNDLDLFANREKYTLLFDGKPKEEIINEYGENDFLITYNDKYYLSFRQFKLNRRHQHNYQFNFQGLKGNPIVEVKIRGEDRMNFKRKMIKIEDADKYVCNTPIDSAGTIFNMIELERE